MFFSMAAVRGLGQLLGDRLSQIRRERELTQDDVARMATAVGLPWARATVVAFENGCRGAIGIQELLLLSQAFSVEPDEWFVGKGWAELTPEAMATLKVIRAMLAGPPVARWIRISERLWDIPQFRDAPNTLGVQFEKLNKLLRKAEEYLGPEFSTDAAIDAIQGAAGPAEVKAAYKLQVKPIDISLAAFKLWGRSLTQERNRRAGEAARAATLRSLRYTKGHITRVLLLELAPTLQKPRLVSTQMAR